MLYNSLAFAIFLPIVFICYWCLPHKFRWILILAASYYFYMSWNVKYVFLIFFTTLVSYVAARLLERTNSKRNRKIILVTSEIVCLGVLFVFKYFNFVSESVSNICEMLSIQLNPITLKLVLPVGISFYTFQTLSYVIDVYRGDVTAEHHFGYYAAFISFFPQLVAGPIERTRNLLPQIKEKHSFDYDQATYGLKLMAWGFFKKLVVADALSPFVKTVYDSPQKYTGATLVAATVFFALQIYCDFSGYSDIALGTARLFGINLMTNFKSPYFSQSIKEFWSRWHISLSTWFKDYIYIPLGGNRVGKVRQAFNLIVTFLVSGLWHGANWKFVIWGAIHGVAQAIENILIPKDKQKSKGIVWFARVIIVFIFVTLAWTFFVANSFTDAIYVISHMLDGIKHPFTYVLTAYADFGEILSEYVYIAISLLLLMAYDLCSLKTDVILAISKKKIVVRWIIYVLLVMWILLNIPYKKTTEFIYFQF